MKNVLLLLLIACTACTPQSAPPATAHDEPCHAEKLTCRRTYDCDPTEMSLECNGSRPR